MSAKVIEIIDKLLDPILKERGLELYDLAFKREGSMRVLRVVIDKESGVTIDDCSWTSEQLSCILDVEDPIPYEYRLEVSSPGVTRPLKTDSHFHRTIGQKIRVRLRRKTGKCEELVGKLLGRDERVIKLGLEAGTTIEIPNEEVIAVNLEFEFP